MGRTSRLAVIGALAIALGGAEQVALAGQADSGSVTGSGGLKRPVASRARVRTENEILKALIREGSERSETFRAVVAAIDATDGLVYLTVGTCGRPRACLLHRVDVAGPNRVLNIIVNVQDNDLAFISVIAHELQHAVEVLGNPSITSDTGIMAFYRNNGIEMKGVIETRTAIAIGDAVRAEVRRSLRR